MNCCFCGKSFEGYGNSTWPIYPDVEYTSEGFPNGEQKRCCDECNMKYVIACRINPIKTMAIREKFNIKTVPEGERND